MKCYNCGRESVEHTGNLELPSDILGSFTISNAQYSKCTGCDEIILHDETWKNADGVEKMLVEKFLQGLPCNESVCATTAAEILGMTRQGLQQHRKIRRGFVHSFFYEGKIHYNVKSLKLYKETGDGRFPLVKQAKSVRSEYVIFVTAGFQDQNRSQGALLIPSGLSYAEAQAYV